VIQKKERKKEERKKKERKYFEMNGEEID